MADWNHPQLGDPYDQVLLYINNRDVDAITLQKSAPSNLPDGAMAYDRSLDLFKEWSLSGLAFINKKLAIAGGGTGADNVTQARVNLGLGTMATQDSNNVNITGGSISGLSVDASAITSGVLALGRGGTGASLSLGADRNFLQVISGAVAFGTDGSLLTNLNANNLASGTVPSARISGSSLTGLNATTCFGSGVVPIGNLPTTLGAVSQIIFGSTTTQATTAGTAYVTSNLSATITPGSSSHKIAVLVSLSLAVIYPFTIGGGSVIANVQIKRAGSVIATFPKVMGLLQSDGNAAAVQTKLWVQIPLMFDDSPSSTSVLVYEVFFAAAVANPSIIVTAQDNVTGTSQSTMILAEHT